MKGISTLGALQYFMDNNMLSDVKTYVGTSAGSAILYLMIIGYTPVEILVYLCMHPIYQMSDSFDMVKLMNGEGGLSFAPIYEILEQMSIDKIGKIPTFGELKETYHISLVVPAYNYTQKKTEYLSWETHPDLLCIMGIRMSSSIPLLFNMYKYKGDFYMDGAITEHFPILVELPDPSHPRLGIVINMEHSAESSSSFSLLEYIYNLSMIPMIEDLKYKKKHAVDTDIIELHSKIGALEFSNTSSPLKLESFSSGYQQAKQFFEQQ